jgi:hypothetical protein
MTAIAPARPTEDWSIVDQGNTDPGILAELERETVRDAVQCAADELGEFSAFDIRCRLARPVSPNRPGGVINGLINSGIIRVVEGHTAKSGNAKSRNRNRDMPTYRLAGETTVA